MAPTSVSFMEIRHQEGEREREGELHAPVQNVHGLSRCVPCSLEESRLFIYGNVYVESCGYDPP